MAVTALILASMMGASVLNSAWEIQWFPGSYFDSRGRLPMQRRALSRWPGPEELMRMWKEVPSDWLWVVFQISRAGPCR